MADDDDGPQHGDGEDEDTTSGDGSLEQRIARLEEMVNRALRSRPAGGSRAAETEERRREMNEALADLRKQERSDALMKRIDSDMRKVKQAVFEKPPREHRRIEHAMGWPDPE